MFLNHLYGGMDEPELKIIDVFVCKLRKKLSNATGGENYIETVWGRGYVLRDPGRSPQRRQEGRRQRLGAPSPSDKTKSPGFRPAISFWNAVISYRGAPAAAAIGKLGIGWRAPLALAEATP